jgi:hypothetical protein
MFFPMKKFFGLILVFVVSCPLLKAQDNTDSLVKYSPDFKFKEGLYLSFDQVKNNDPLPKSRIIATIDYDDPDFFDRILEGKAIYYYDNVGNKNELKTSGIWGYSRNGFIYIKMNNSFYRITLIGAVSHFIASETTYTTNYNSPYYYNSYMDPYRTYPSSYPTTEMRQYVLDFKTGRVMDYSETALDVIFMQDPEIHDEYVSMNNKKRKQMKFYYMRKYNTNNPLYFPKN